MTMNQDEYYAAICALFPSGAAFSMNDGTIRREKSVTRMIVWAIAGMCAAFDDACQSALEQFFCGTATDDLDVWLAEYGLPDACDQLGGTLCAKAGFVGAAQLEDYIAFATALGWTCDMRWLTGDDTEFPGVVCTLHIKIYPDLSPAVEDAKQAELKSWLLPVNPLGEPDTTGLVCVLSNIIPAHCAVTYEVL